MSHLVRFSVSLEEELLKSFDKHIQEQRYENRSEALRDLIREELVAGEWQKNEKGSPQKRFSAKINFFAT